MEPARMLVDRWLGLEGVPSDVSASEREIDGEVTTGRGLV